MKKKQINSKEKDIDKEFREKYKNFKPIFGCSEHIRISETVGSIQQKTKEIRIVYDTNATIIRLRNELTDLKKTFIFQLRDFDN